MPTLIEVAKDSSTQLEANVLRTITERSPLMERIPFITVSGMQYAFNRERSLPTVATRNIGGTYTANSGVIEQVNEPLRIYGGEVKIDNFEVKQGGNVRDAKNRQFRMKARAMALTFSQDFLEGDGDLNPSGVNGLRNRITASSQLINAGKYYRLLEASLLDRNLPSIVTVESARASASSLNGKAGLIAGSSSRSGRTAGTALNESADAESVELDRWATLAGIKS